MESILATALTNLTEIQSQAVEWHNGALLVLAGPGSGKTQVLTCRIAKLLDELRDQKFRVLALTFTNKAADEMKSRVGAFVPGLEARATIGTFHSFCAQVLRQHGIHVGINPDFAIYSSDGDRRAILEDALSRAGRNGHAVSASDAKYIEMIDRLKSHLVAPSATSEKLALMADREQIALVFKLYEQELRLLNSLDFNSLIFEAYQLFTSYPAIATSYRRSHPYWMIDEFQDTNSAQYRLIRQMAGDDFRNLFAVADDDQIIFGWNGASFNRIQSFVNDYTARLIQLPTNYRCPPAIVTAANRLVSYNAQRTQSKQPLIAGKTQTAYPRSDHLQVHSFETDEAEALGIAHEIAQSGAERWGKTAILARTNALLQRVDAELKKLQVSAAVAQRRDDFLSPEFRWMVAALRQISRPLDRRNLTVMIDAFNRLACIDVSPEHVIADSDTTGFGYIDTWTKLVANIQGIKCENANLVTLLAATATDTLGYRAKVEQIIDVFSKRVAGTEHYDDLAEDITAWKQLNREIFRHIDKTAPLDHFLQDLQMRSKEPIPPPNTVLLMTIHGAKGREFDFVYVIGLAEDVLPSYQSKQKGDTGPELEEERRNCFVAITRTKECLVLSRANKYKGYKKAPSRFLVEMGLVAD